MSIQYPYENSREFAKNSDSRDPLRSYKEKFHFPRRPNGQRYIYFCGNSLGLQPITARGQVEKIMSDWEKLGVEGHFKAEEPWVPYHERLTPGMARVVGARHEEVVVMNSLTVNLHLMMVSFYRPTPARNKILIEKHAFPSDQYAVASQIEFHGYDPKDCLLELSPRDGEKTLRKEDILGFLKERGEEIALVLMGGLNYYTGQVYPLREISQTARKMGCVVGFDLAHAVGNVALELHDWGVDFAVWCTYKYMNSGPGGIAGCFVHERHKANRELPRFAGWWGHNKEKRFLMEDLFDPIPGAEGWQLSCGPILLEASFRASLDLFEEVGMPALLKKSRLLTGFLEFLILQLKSEKIEIITPADPRQRGCQLSVAVKGSDKSLFHRIHELGVITDWREPDVIRVAPAPFYNSFEEVYEFVLILKRALEE